MPSDSDTTNPENPVIHEAPEESLEDHGARLFADLVKQLLAEHEKDEMWAISQLDGTLKEVLEEVRGMRESVEANTKVLGKHDKSIADLQNELEQLKERVADLEKEIEQWKREAAS